MKFMVSFPPKEKISQSLAYFISHSFFILSSRNYKIDYQGDLWTILEAN